MPKKRDLKSIGHTKYTTTAVVRAVLGYGMCPEKKITCYVVQTCQVHTTHLSRFRVAILLLLGPKSQR